MLWDTNVFVKIRYLPQRLASGKIVFYGVINITQIDPLVQIFLLHIYFYLYF